VEHDYLLLWRRYTRVLKQRNAALRQSNPAVVESLDPQLIVLGEQLHQSRQRHAEILCEKLMVSLPLFSDMLEGITLSYRKGWAGDSLAEAITASSQRDADRGSTGPGPHKADLYLSLNGVLARDRLSRGEQKAMTAAMIMAQAQMICESGEKPLLLMDDVASELDEAHLSRVLSAALDLGVQIWLTGTKLVPAITSCGGSNAVFHVKQGRVTKTTEIAEKTSI